jgi:hypothetical protein
VSAAATAAGYLYAHNRLAAAGHPAGHNSRQMDAKRDAQRPHRAVPSQASRRWEPRFEPQTALRHDEPQPVKEARTPRIEYRKRRVYPAAA